MFEIPLGEPEYREPWQRPFGERVREFRAESFRVAYYDRYPNNSTFRYRAYNMVELINQYVDGASASYFWDADRERLFSVLREADLLVVGRVPYKEEAGYVLSVARAAGVRVVFDVDDLVFDLSALPEVLRTLGQYLPRNQQQVDRHWDTWYGSFSRIRRTLELCDEVIVTNDFLAEQARGSVDKPVHVISNFIGADQLAYSQQVVAARRAAGDVRDGSIHLGYFSGTPTHNQDFAIVAEPLATVMRRHPDVRLRVVGYLDKKLHVFDDLLDRVDFVPFTNYLNLQRLIAQTEVNIAPLQNNRFTNCKSELKYFDAAVVGIPTLASCTYTMSRAITDQVNGMLVPADSWQDALEQIVTDYDGLGRQLGNAALADAEANYSPAAHVDVVRQVLGLPGSA